MPHAETVELSNKTCCSGFECQRKVVLRRLQRHRRYWPVLYIGSCRAFVTLQRTSNLTTLEAEYKGISIQSYNRGRSLRTECLSVH